MAEGTITKRLSGVLNELEAEFENPALTLFNRQDFLRLIEELRCLGSSSRTPSVLAELFRMFDTFGIKYEKGQPVEYYAKIVEAAELPNAGDLEVRMFRAMYAKFDKYPLPQEYMTRVVDKFSNAEDEWHGDTLRLRILKQFIKYGDYLRGAGFGGHLEIKNYVKPRISGKITAAAVCQYLNDDIFDRLETANKEQKKPDGKFGLIKLADDLAAGKFRTGGATKRGLYMFAMVFNMTGADLEKHLFRDYYSNNIMRFITDAYSDGLGDYEMTPSGQGINYKNFAEMIYLYFLGSNDTPENKIRLSAQMIREVKTENSVRREFPTIFYRGFRSKIFAQPPAQFKKFIADNYDCSLSATDSKTGKSYGIGFMQAQLEQNTALAIQKELLQKLSKLLDVRECRYGLWFVDLKALDVPDSSRFRDFKILLECLDKLLKNENLFDPKNVSRTSLEVIYYYYYNEFHNTSDVPDTRQNFERHLRNFKSGLDKFLERAFYQPFDTRNFFDVALAFSSYAYLNL